MIYDRRKYTRYIPPDSLVALAEFRQKTEQRLQLRNIGIDGFCFVTPEDISAETFFNLVLEIVDQRATRRIETPAKIVWVAYNQDTSRYTAGVQFLGLNERDRTFLEKVLSVLEPEIRQSDKYENP